MPKLSLNKIKPNSWNPHCLSVKAREQLKERMAEAGVERTPPIIVRKEGEVYVIIDGEERWSIAKELGWTEINAEIVKCTDEDARFLTLSLNEHWGEVDWFDLSDKLAKDELLVRSVIKHYGTNKIKDLRILQRFTPKAKLMLKQAMREKGIFPTLEVLATIAKVPPKYQLRVCEEIVNGYIAPTEFSSICETFDRLGLTSETTHLPKEKLVEKAQPVAEKPAYKEKTSVTPCGCEDWSSWHNKGCGEGSCLDTQRLQIRSRNCNPSECDIEEQTQCVNDPQCISKAKEPSLVASTKKNAEEESLLAAIGNIFSFGTGNILVKISAIVLVLAATICLFWFLLKKRKKSN